jgi:predicted component of type VI protein secretion system
VPTSRATVIRPESFPQEEAASAWLQRLRDDEDERERELDAAVAVLNRALHAHRAARADHAARDVTAAAALVVRAGWGAGERVADGRFREGWELPRRGRRVRRSMEAPDERFAALLGGREAALACEELVLRARADVDAGRMREGALQARVALEGVLAELPDLSPGRRTPLEEARGPVGQAANAALRGPLDPGSATAVAGAVEAMERALRAHRLGTSG